MSILWQNSSEEPKPGALSQQSRLTITQVIDEVSLLLTIPKPPFGLRVYLHNTSGYPQSPFKGIYDSLMQLARQNQVSPQVSDLSMEKLVDKTRTSWFGFKHQASEGRENQHFLVNPSLSSSKETVFGVSRSDNSLVYRISFLRSHYGEEVFAILSGLMTAMKSHNESQGHWHDVLQSVK